MSPPGNNSVGELLRHAAQLLKYSLSNVVYMCRLIQVLAQLNHILYVLCAHSSCNEWWYIITQCSNQSIYIASTNTSTYVASYHLLPPCTQCTYTHKGLWVWVRESYVKWLTTLTVGNVTWSQLHFITHECHLLSSVSSICTYIHT